MGAYASEERVQVDDAYLAENACGARPGRGSENKVPVWRRLCR